MRRPLCLLLAVAAVVQLAAAYGAHSSASTVLHLVSSVGFGVAAGLTRAHRTRTHLRRIRLFRKVHRRG